MQPDFEARTAERLRAEIATLVPDDLAPPPLPSDQAKVPEPSWLSQRRRNGAHRALRPLLVAAAVAVVATGLVLVIRPTPDEDLAGTAPAVQAPGPSSIPTTPSSAPPAVAPVDDDPAVRRVPLSPEAESAARVLVSNRTATISEDQAATWKVGDVPVSRAVRSGATGLTLSIGGYPPGFGPCEQPYTVSVLETETAVVVHVVRDTGTGQDLDEADTPEVACVLAIPVGVVAVELARPLGSREVLDLSRWATERSPQVEVPAWSRYGAATTAAGG